MAQIHSCEDSSDAVTLYPVLGLFLKPISRINISIHYPALKQSLLNGGKSVSSWELMEKIKALTLPDHFIQLRIMKNTLEFIRFEGDLENRDVLKGLTARLEGKALKLTGFKEPFKVRTSEAKVQFPAKYDWDSYFRDAKHMNEMKAGERPDTIHFQHLPTKWFSQRKTDEKPLPSEKLFRRVWETFGEIRAVDIPSLDPYRQKMNNSIPGIKTFTFNIDCVFDAYVQYKDYMSFVKAMDALRGMFLLYQENNKHWVASVKVDFDKTKHLSDDTIRKRQIERDRLMTVEKNDQYAKLKELRDLQSGSKAAKPKERKDIFDSEDEEIKSRELEQKIATEERKYVIARRKLEAIRLIDYLFEVVKIKLEIKKKAEKIRKKIEVKKLKKKRKKLPEDHCSSEERIQCSDVEGSGADRGRTKRFTQVIGRYKEMHEYKVEQQEEKLRRVRPQDETSPRFKLEENYHHNKRSSNNNHVAEGPISRKRQFEETHPPHHRSPPTTVTRYLGDWEVGVKYGPDVREFDMPQNIRKSPLLPDPEFSYASQNEHHRFPQRGRGGYYHRGNGRYQSSQLRSHPYTNSHYSPNTRNGRGYDTNNNSNHGRNDRHYEDDPRVHGPSYQEELEQAYEKYFKSVTLRNEIEKRAIDEARETEDELSDIGVSVKEPTKSKSVKSSRHKKVKSKKPPKE